MINQATLLGRVGKIDTKTTSNGTKICNFSIATSKRFVKDGQKQEKSTWHNVTAFQKLAEIADNYINVGDMIFVQGEMESQKYTGNDGQEKYRNFIIANTIQMLPKAKESKPAKAAEPNPAFQDDDIPW